MNNFQQNSNFIKDLTYKLNIIIKWVIENTNTEDPKIQDAIYSYKWLLAEINPFNSKKFKNPNKRQRKAAIDVLKELCECTMDNKETLKIIKKAAEVVKAEIGRRFKD